MWSKSSLLLLCSLSLSALGACGPGEEEDAGPADAGAQDAAPLDGALSDSTVIDATPLDAEPADADPVDADPIDAQPVDTGPIDAQPVDADPIDADPVDADPVDADPIDADPIDADPVDADPVDAEPADADAGGAEDAWIGDTGFCPYNGNWNSDHGIPLTIPHPPEPNIPIPSVSGIALSGDGRYVAFAANEPERFVPFPAPSPNPTVGVFRHDLRTGEQVLLQSLATSDRVEVIISNDGSVVTPILNPTNSYFVGADDGVTYFGPTVPDLCQRPAFPFAPCNGSIADVVTSSSGRYVAFKTTATDAHPLDTNPGHDIYFRELQGGTNELVTADPITGLPLNASQYEETLEISEDGSLVYYSLLGQVMIWDRIADTRLPGDLPLWRQGCNLDGPTTARNCQATRDGTTALHWTGDSAGGVVRALPGPPMAPCPPPTRDLSRYYSRQIWSWALAPSRAPVWTGSELIVWMQTNLTTDMQRYSPADGTFGSMFNIGAPGIRLDYSGTWLGDRYLIWGGVDGSGVLQSGYAYSPVAGAWTQISTTGAPSARIKHGAVWTGQYLVVFGGEPVTGDLGGRYDPATDTWLSMSDVGAPSHLAVGSGASPQLFWTGTEVLVWTGADLGRYDPASDAWLPVTPSQPLPSPYPNSTFAGWVDGALFIFDPSTEVLGVYDPMSQIYAESATSYFGANGATYAFTIHDAFVVTGVDRAYAFRRSAPPERLNLGVPVRTPNSTPLPYPDGLIYDQARWAAPH
jgi:hypothetical protein